MSIILRALREARSMIEIERTAFVECQVWPDGSLRGPDAEICAQYDHVIDLLRAALEAAQREQAQDEHDAVRIMRTVIDKGHDYVLIVEPRNSGSRMQMDSGMRRIEIARMLERFARGAREDARLGGGE